MALKELQEKRSKLLADRKELSAKVVAENRPFTAEEKEKIAAMKAEYDDLSFTCGELSEQESQAMLLDRATRAAAGRQDVGGDEEPIFDKKSLRKYSFLKVLNSLADKRPIEGLEREMSDELAKHYGTAPRGCFIPSAVLIHRPRAGAVDTSTGTGGVSTVTSGDYIDALRNVSILGQLPITFLTGLQGKLALPRTSGNSAYWPGDATAPTAGANTLDAVTLSDKPIACYQDFTRSFMKQTSLSVDAFARDQLVKAIGSGLCTAVMNGTGGTNTLLGVLNRTDSNLATVIGPTRATSGAVAANLTGAAMTWAAAVMMETAVSAANVMIDSGVYVASSAGVGAMKTAAKASNAALFVAEDGQMNGYPLLGTNGVPSVNGTNSSSCSAIFGNWSDAVVGMWGGLDLTVDPYALATSGGIRFIAFQNVDLQLRQAASFCRMYGIAG
jgi:HK97 family phage major capsid protein